MFLVRPTLCAATVIDLARYAGVRKVARPEYRYGGAIKTRATKRSIVFLRAKARPFD